MAILLSVVVLSVKRIFYLLSGLLAVLPLHVTAGNDAAMVNALRERAGLAPLAHASLLDEAAARHAAYLDRHREPGKATHGLSAHEQQPGQEGFSGENPGARALAVGYPHRQVLENVSMGYADTGEAIDGLMSAIYHRLTFLDPKADQLGTAVGERSRVFLLGRTDLAAACNNPPARARYQAPVDCLGQTITRPYYQQLCRNIPQAALFKPSHPVTCPNGVRLRADYMAKVCSKPPPEARFGGHGRYYAACENGTRLDADWFNALCERQPDDAVYAASGSYYEICDDKRAVNAEWLEAQCAAVPDSGRYQDSGRYRQPCADDVDMRVEYLDQLDEAARQAVPELVVWPPQGLRDIPPAFYIEDPDPLPDRDVAGYPISLQFNPAKVDKIEIERFALFRLQDEERIAVTDVRLLDAGNDPHHLLSSHEFALFPLQRLAWSTRYLVSLSVKLDGEPQQLEWTFTTCGDDMPLLTVAQPTERFTFDPRSVFRVYVPPGVEASATVLRTHTEFLRGNQVDIKVVDPNTLEVQVALGLCDRIRMQFDDGRRAELIPQGCR